MYQKYCKGYYHDKYYKFDKEHNRTAGTVFAEFYDKLLGQTGMRFIIGLEMLPVTVQPALDAFNARQTDADELEHKTQWEKHWGHAYSMYRPVLETARRFDLPVAALNIPRKTLLHFRDDKRSLGVKRRCSHQEPLVFRSGR